MTKSFFLCLVTALLASYANAQLDITASKDFIFTSHVKKYYYDAATNAYKISDNSATSVSAATAYFKYGFGQKENSNISIGIPIGLSGNSEEDDASLSYHINLMVDYNYGFYSQRMDEADMKKFGFYVGIGGGMFKTNATPHITGINYMDIPTSKITNIPASTDSYSYMLNNNPISSSYGIQAHFGISYLFYSYTSRYALMIPTGLRCSVYKSLDGGINYFTVGLIYNYRSVRNALRGMVGGSDPSDYKVKYKFKRARVKQYYNYTY